MKTGKQKAALMIQGTTSNAGKSVLTTAFCRILSRKGYSVAPFKAQNMSLNSFVTRDGKEMGRAQVVQAQACRKDPDVRMNPVLLKPNSNTGSQIIVMGKPVGSMNIQEYTKYKKELISTVHQAYDELAKENDIIVLEGAGSPAEVNLKSDDIVNMSMARHANASVLICGDIDRGGVYAHFIGTMMCLDSIEQNMVKGFLVNRFRGDATLLARAHDFVSQKTGKPVLGVIPYLNSIAIPDEDSVSFKNANSNNPDVSKSITISLIDLPHISNATDIDPFYLEPDVNLRIVRSCKDIDGSDVIILPGSKNVISDLFLLHSEGIVEKTLDAFRKKSAVIIGICGGFQMLGKKIFDPYGIECQTGTETNGLGLLDISSILEHEKTLRLTQVYDSPSDCHISGYEIHHGITNVSSESVPIMMNEEQQPTGAKNADSSVWGTYLHGIFDNDKFRRFFIDTIRTRKGLYPLETIQSSFNINNAIDRLADCVEESTDMNAILRFLGLQ